MVASTLSLFDAEIGIHGLRLSFQSTVQPMDYADCQDCERNCANYCGGSSGCTKNCIDTYCRVVCNR